MDDFATNTIGLGGRGLHAVERTELFLACPRLLSSVRDYISDASSCLSVSQSLVVRERVTTTPRRLSI